MRQANNLTSIVRKIDSTPKTLATFEQVIVYDHRRKQVINKKPLFSGNNVELYLVSTNKVIQHEGLHVTVEDFATNRKIGLLINYRASCMEGSQSHLVASLCRDHSPGFDLNRRVEQWVFSFTRDRAGEFIDNFVSQLHWLSRELQYAAEHIG